MGSLGWSWVVEVVWKLGVRELGMRFKSSALSPS